VQGLAHGLSVIEAFDEENPEMTVSEVARRAGLSPATARRSLLTLAHLGYGRWNQKKFILGARILALGSAYLRSAGVQETLLPELRAIVAQCGDTAGVAVQVGFDILYLAHHSEQRGMRPVAGTGIRYPAYPTSLGRVLLAHLPKRALDSYFATARFEHHTDYTEIDPRRLRAILAAVRKNGFASVVDQLFYGVTSLSVPIHAPGGEVVAALNTSGYSGQVTVEMMIAKRLPVLRESALRIGATIARYPALLQSLNTMGGAPAEDGAARASYKLFP
jgi:IclR family pca regulon transcriptional regulator